MLRYIAVLSGVAFMVAASPAQAGSGNTLYVLQDSSVRPDLGNEIHTDQSLASDSLIGTSFIPATQKGALNEADLSVEGHGGTIQLYQDNEAAFAAPIGNTATIHVDGTSAAIAVQKGDGNTTQIEVSGFLAAGSTTQLGDLNKARLFVDGPLAAGTIIQNGDENDAQLNVGGFSAVTYIQYGNGLSYEALQGTPQGVTVWSNAGTVLITQTSY